MTPDQRASVRDLLAIQPESSLPEHGLRTEGVPFVSGAVRRQRISYAVPGGVRLSAWMLRPAVGNGPWPGILALHPHSDRFDLGGDEVAGQCGLREHHYGHALAAKGFTVLCPDLPCFGQQQAPPGFPAAGRWESLCLSKALAHGRSLLSESLDQLRCAVAALIDYEKTADLTISVVGYGMGARAAAWLAWVDHRVGAVWMHAGLGQVQILLDQGRLLPRHTLLPGLLAKGLDQADVVADLLPRGVGISFGKHDQIAVPGAVAPVLAALRARHELMPQAKVAVIEGDYDHRFPAEVVEVIAKHLLSWSRGG